MGRHLGNGDSTVAMETQRLGTWRSGSPCSLVQGGSINEQGSETKGRGEPCTEKASVSQTAIALARRVKKVRSAEGGAEL